MVVSLQKKYLTGFTLAETLITLMVIGILVVITIPGLIQSWEKMTLKSQAKEALAILNQAYYQTMSEEGFECYYYMQPNGSAIQTYSADCTNFYKSFFSKLKVAKLCKGNALSDGCIPDYEQLDLTLEGCPWFKRDNVNQYDYVRVLANGIIIFDYGKDSFPIFGIDVNGIKPPNQLGKDVFGLRTAKMSNNNSYTITSSKRLNACLNFSALDPSEYYFKTLDDLYK